MPTEAWPRRSDYDLGVHTLGQQLAGVGVAQVVPANLQLGRQMGLERAPRPLEVRREPGAPVGAGEDQVGFSVVGRPKCQPLGVLLDLVTTQRGQGQLRQRYTATTAGRLRALEAQTAAGLLDRLLDAQGSRP